MPRGVADRQAWCGGQRDLAWFLPPLGSICDLTSHAASLPESRSRHPHSGRLSYRTVCPRTQEDSGRQAARQAVDPSLGRVFLPLFPSGSSSVQWVGLTSWALQQLPALMQSEPIGPKGFAGPVRPAGLGPCLCLHAGNRPVSLCLSKSPPLAQNGWEGLRVFQPKGAGYSERKRGNSLGSPSEKRFSRVRPPDSQR